MTDPHRLADDHERTPFTADEIRDGNRAGRTIHMRVAPVDAPAFTQTSRYVQTDDEGALQEFSRLDERGVPIGDPERRRSTWLELQEHASFPSSRTTVESDAIDSPLGRLACLRYTVTDGDDLDTFWFAEGYPGMPIRIESRQAGRLVSTLTVTTSTVENV